MDWKLGRLIASTLLLAAGAAGCESVINPQGPAVRDVTQSIGDRYVNRPVQDIAARYGIPDEQTEFQGERVYTWHFATNRQWRRPVETTTAGTIGDPSRPWAQVPYHQTTTAISTETTRYECRMDVYVRPDGTIRTLGLHGQVGACETLTP